jgi:hypothetical protein
MSAHPINTSGALGDHIQDATPQPGRRGLPRRIAVLSDGSGFTGVDSASKRASVESGLHAWMTAIQKHTGLSVRVLNITSGDIEELSTRLRRLPADLSGVVVINTRPDHLGPIDAWAQDRECPVITGRSLAAVAVTAALLTSLTRQGRLPGRSRVVIAGAADMPILSQLLITSGIGEVIQWNRDDALSFSLRCVAAQADAVIDLLGGPQGLADAVNARPELMVITPDRIDWALLALPGLLDTVITTSPPAATVETCCASALELVAATPPGRLLPQPTRMVPSAGRWNPTTSGTARGGIPWQQRSLRRAVRRARSTGTAPAAPVACVTPSRTDHHTRFTATPGNLR